MELRAFLTSIATQLVQELEPILTLKGVTENSALLGAYTEACVRRLAHRVVAPMRVSTGAVLDHPMPGSLRQLDVIIWAPFPSPAVYEVHDFALVPRSSASGVIEVKRSNYTGVDTQLEGFLENPGPIVAAPDPVLGDTAPAVMGVIPALSAAPSARLASLLAGARVVALFEPGSQGLKVRHEDVLRLVNFLNYISWRYRVRASQPWVPQIDLQSFGAGA